MPPPPTEDLNNTIPKKIGIIGAGLTGLTIASRLSQGKVPIRIFESQPEVGGVIQSFCEKGFIAEAGPHSMLVKDAQVAQFLNTLNVEACMVEANPAAKKRFLVKNNKLEPLPSSLMGFLRTPLLSAKGKLRLLKEPFIAKRKEQAEEESFGEFISRRLGIEALHSIADPWVSGIHAGDPNQLSIRYAFEKLWKMEQESGSLIRGGFKALKAIQKKRKEEAQKKSSLLFKSKMISFRQGMQTLPLALRETLPKGSLLTGTKVTAIHKNRQGWEIHYTQQEHAQKEIVEHLVLAVPAHQLARLPFVELEPLPLKNLAAITYPSVSILTLGFLRSQVNHPLDGFGVLVPHQERHNILGVIFASTLFPDRAPENYVTLSVFVGGARHPNLGTQSTEDLWTIIRNDLKTLLGVSGDPAFTKHVCWPKAIPQYNLGYGPFLETIAHCKTLYPTLSLAGSYHSGTSVEQCLLSGLKETDMLLKIFSL